MVTMSLFLLVLIVVGLGMWWGALSKGAVVMGLMVGLLGASTPLGGSLTGAIDSGGTAAVAGLSDAFAGDGGSNQAPGNTVPAKPSGRQPAGQPKGQVRG